MNPFKRKSILGGALSFAAITACALVVVVVVGCGSPTRVPSDQELIASFHAHHDTFEQIEAMAAKDRRNGLYLRWHRESWWCPGNWWWCGSSKPSGMPPSRLEDYGKLISQIRPEVQHVGINHDGTTNFMFAASGVNFRPDWWSKGIAYIPPDVDLKTQGVPLPDLNGAPGLPANDYIREIEPAWFLFYQREER
jgi:hypothetical protein